MIKNITVIGSGVMGTGIAISFAINGYPVVLNDLNDEFLEKAERRIKQDLALLVEEGAVTSTGKADAIKNIKYTTDLADASKDADFIIEAIPEVIDLKWSLYHKLEDLKKESAIIASNTSTFPISRLVEKASFANKMIITHYFNPGHLVPLVEIVKHEQTEKKVVEDTIQLMRDIGKAPIVLQKEISGFVANRLQTALMREAFYLLKEGIASAEDIDTAVTAGPGFRWAFTGPIEIADFGGLDTWQRVFENVAPDLDQSMEAPEMISKLVAEQKLGAKSGEGIFRYGDESVSDKLKERDRAFIRLGNLKQ
ncbi:3-hydroxyacyl-CoA dehydrogenase family protein [Cytobacillus purgationiresistens]|uniref:L-gulonate 3-dehydrogenase n=1 Tax=Cytobacillus purgationiresistens TaxID=863449 RepID=A0ABU0AQK7_9BACI|nr:3-hydroxyacyl-CoA dehydrogenase family protein [Cytobacillus purgationiresistens]MDQ0272688.1 3-hydroxybutyryl-CoA dehydrogenase [Cytobacillus purgationiresistens]